MNSYAISEKTMHKIKKKIFLKPFDYEPFSFAAFILGTISGIMGGPVRFPLKNPCPPYAHHKPKNNREKTETIYYFHGWGELMPEKNLGPETYESSEVFTLYFSEYRENVRFKTSFGQKQDVKESLQCLKNTYNEERKSITLVGRSRGGHVLILLLISLVANLDNILDEVGIDQKMQQKLIQQIKAGRIIIVVPLLNMQKTLKYHFGEKIGNWWHEKFGPKLTEKLYDPNGWHAEICLENCNKKEFTKPQFNTTLIYALYKNILKNSKDIESFIKQYVLISTLISFF